MDFAIGIDIGSTCAKTAVLAANGSFALLSARPTGWSSVDTAEAIRAELEAASFSPESYPCVATGYGRVAVPYAGKSVTEITCHARGACFLHGRDDLLVIDIGGQDTKVIGVSGGAVQDFLMNDKCSAGTGRFLEIMADRLGISQQQMADLARFGEPTKISSMCTVFAESEVVSLIGQGASREDIAYAVVDSIAGKVATQAKKLGGSYGAVCLTGGLCQTEYLPDAIAEKLGAPILTHPEGRFAGAIGAGGIGDFAIRYGYQMGQSAPRSPHAGSPDKHDTY